MTMTRRVLVVFGLMLLAVGADAVTRVILANHWVREATGALHFGWAGAAGVPLMHSFCDSATGDRVLIVASRELVRGGERAQVHALAVVPRGCADWPR